MSTEMDPEIRDNPEEMTQNVEDSDEFKPAKTKSRKRKLEEPKEDGEKAMETTPVPVKVPLLPPISAEKLKVFHNIEVADSIFH